MEKTYIISDLHIGDERQPKSSRNNFMYKNKYARFAAFLEQVKREKAGLLILGDLFDFWLANVDGVIQHNWHILDTLADMENVVYIPGNHDTDFAGFYTPDCAQRTFLNHPFFLDPQRVKLTHDLTIGTTRFVFRHGHEGDSFNDSPYPVTGRMVTIFAGLVEDRMSRYVDYDDGQTLPVEPALTALSDVALWLFNAVADSLESLKDGRLINAADGGRSEEALGDRQRVFLKKAQAAGMTGYEKRIRLQGYVLDSLFDRLAGAVELSLQKPCGAAAALDGTDGSWWREMLKKALLDHFRKWVDEHDKCGDRVANHLHTMYHDYWDKLPDKNEAVMVVGHTHLPGFCRDKPNGSDRVWYYNSGSWSDLDHDVLTLDEKGEITYYTCTENGLEKSDPTDFTDFL